VNNFLHGIVKTGSMRFALCEGGHAVAFYVHIFIFTEIRSDLRPAPTSSHVHVGMWCFLLH
jgi:hypothetical protein